MVEALAGMAVPTTVLVTIILEKSWEVSSFAG
jgi:hypothetical protein